MRLHALLRASGRSIFSQSAFGFSLPVRPNFSSAFGRFVSDQPSLFPSPLPSPTNSSLFKASSILGGANNATSLARAGVPAVSSAPMASFAAPEPEVIGSRHGNAAAIILNRPKALNSLNDNMVELMRYYLEEWENDPSINLVIVRSDGRAFCAGGDVRRCHDLAKQGNWLEGAEFFRKEYDLDYLVATYKKPYVAVINGVVMGGGNGISMHAPFRVVSEKVLFAMPETLIGLHPDVGASYFLSRLPGHLGEFLALTGVRLRAADMVACGLATHIVTSDRLHLLEERLCALRIPDFESIELAINEHADAAHPQELIVMPRLAIIDKCFQHPTVEEIMAALEEGAAAVTAESAEENADSAAEKTELAGEEKGEAEAAAALAKEEARLDAVWCGETLAALKKMSPTSLKVSLRSIREGREQSLAECLVKETRLSYRCMEQTTSHDFIEGVRALLVDKDNSPKFNPPTLAEVTPEMVDKHFAPLDDPSRELKLDVKTREGGKFWRTE